MSKPTIDQFKGCLLGLAVGDAVGAPVEKSPVSETRSYIERCVDPKDFSDAPSSTFEDLPFGSYTDDTQLARELAESLCWHHGKLDVGHYATRIASMFERGYMVGAGRGTKKAAQKLIDGTPWDKAGDTTGGNGSAMRVAPLGLVCADPEEALELARLQSRITHQSEEAQLAAGLIAVAVWYASHTEEDGPAIVTKLGLLLEEEDPSMSQEVLELARFDDDSACLEYILDEVQGPTQWGGVNPYCRSSVYWSLYSFMRSPEDYWSTIRRALWAGGDVDTMAAMAGAISGARNGTDQIPSEVSSRLRGDRDRGALYLTTLMESLYNHAGT